MKKALPLLLLSLLTISCNTHLIEENEILQKKNQNLQSQISYLEDQIYSLEEQIYSLEYDKSNLKIENSSLKNKLSDCNDDLEVYLYSNIPYIVERDVPYKAIENTKFTKYIISARNPYNARVKVIGSENIFEFYAHLVSVYEWDYRINLTRK